LTILTFTLFVLIVAYFAGLLGSLTGLGGGFVLIPVLVLGFDINIHYAMGASLIAVIANSSGAAMSYLKNGFMNLRVGMLLESGAVIGALCGALLVKIIPPSYIAVLFGCILLFSSYLTWRRHEDIISAEPSHPWATYLHLESGYQTGKEYKQYRVYHVPGALFFMIIAGAMSGLLGIGAGALKVLAMDQTMKLPYKVSTTTSNFIIGITAGVSTGVYFSQGYIDPLLTFPVVIGVLLGAISGAKALTFIRTTLLRKFFSAIILVLGFQMIYKGLFGG